MIASTPGRAFAFRILTIFLLTLISVPRDGFGQTLKKSKKLFQEKKYEQALLLLQEDKKTEQNPDYLMQRAICYYYTRQIDKSLEDLKKLERFNTGNPEAWKYTGLCMMKKSNYVEASRFLKKFISKIKPEHPDYKNIILEIRRCGMAYQRQRYPQSAFVENAGTTINSSGIECRPLFSPNFQDRIYFSSSRPGSTGGKRDDKGLLDETGGQYYLDMYYSDFFDGNWSNPTTFLPLLNTPKHDILADFNSDGNILYYGITSNLTQFDFYADTFSINNHYEKLPEKIDLPVNGQKGDKDLFFFNDSLLFFASEYLSGYGGFDLFYCQKNQGVWQSPVNFGPEINSPFDEVSPHMSIGGNTLYFSSNRLDGFGGLDIFHSSFDIENNAWRQAENLGLPVNSPWDENYFILSPDGTHAIFTGNQPSGSGKEDLYLAYFKDQIIEQLLYTETPAFLNPVLSITKEEENDVYKPRLKKEIRIRPLYYTNNADILSSANIPELLKLAETMLIYPDAKLTIYSHSFQETSRDMDLYLSMKRAESIKDYLNKKGIASERLTMKACGASYPLATPYINGIKSNIAERNNKRIDFQLTPITSDLEIVKEAYGIADLFKDEKLTNFLYAEDTLVFRLLIAETEQMYRSEVLNLYDEIYIEKTGNQVQYAYILGNFSRYNEARNVKNELFLNHGIKAEMLPYFKGKPLAKELFPYMSKELPELDKFINNEK